VSMDPRLIDTVAVAVLRDQEDGVAGLNGMQMMPLGFPKAGDHRDSRIADSMKHIQTSNEGVRPMSTLPTRYRPTGHALYDSESTQGSKSFKRPIFGRNVSERAGVHSGFGRAYTRSKVIDDLFCGLDENMAENPDRFAVASGAECAASGKFWPLALSRSECRNVLVPMPYSSH